MRFYKSIVVLSLVVVTALATFFVQSAETQTLDDAELDVLVNKLNDKDDITRFEAALLLGQSRDPRAVPHLIERLKVWHALDRYSVVWALVEIGEPSVYPLISALSRRNLRYGAAYALGCFRDPRAIDPLVAALENNGSYANVAIAYTLGGIGEPALAPLIATLKDPAKPKYVRHYAAIALGRTGNRQAIAPLIDALHDEKSVVREAAAEALGMLGNPTAVSPLIATLKDSKKKVRVQAAIALGKIGDDRAVEPLILTLKKKSARTEAIWALGEIGDQRAFDPLLGMLKKRNESVRAAAAEALGKLGDPRAIEPLIKVLKDKKEIVRQYAAWALGQIGDPVAVPHLIIALRGKRIFEYEEYITSVEIFNALVAIGEPAVDLLLQAVSNKKNNKYIRSFCIGALGQIGNSRAVETLIDALNDKKKWVRWQAAKALGAIGDSRAVPFLVAALQNGNNLMRNYASRALAQIGGPVAEEALLTGFRNQDLWIVAGGYTYFLSRSEPGSEELLIKALKKCPNKEIALAYLNSGNRELMRAALKCARRLNLHPAIAGSPCRGHMGEEGSLLIDGGITLEPGKSSDEFQAREKESDEPQDGQEE